MKYILWQFSSTKQCLSSTPVLLHDYWGNNDKPVEQQWLIERFEMYKKDLEESWVYQRILNEGLEKGLEEGREVLRETLISFLNARYPMLVDLAQEQISGITDIKRLQENLNKVFSFQTAGEIEEYLLSLHDDATKN